MGGRKGAAYVSARGGGRLAWVGQGRWRAALDRCRRRREGKSQSHRRYELHKSSSVHSIAMHIEIEIQRSTRMPEQGSHACCAGRSSSETVVRCCCFSGALGPNKRVERTVTRWFLTSRRQDQFCAELSIHGAARALSVRHQHRKVVGLWRSGFGMAWNAFAGRRSCPIHAAARLQCCTATLLHSYTAARLQHCMATLLHGQSVCRSQRHCSFDPIAS